MKYILKTKGTARIPNYIQIRDENFQLIEHCTVSKSVSIIKKLGIKIEGEDILTFIEDMPFGKLLTVDN